MSPPTDRAKARTRRPLVLFTVVIALALAGTVAELPASDERLELSVPPLQLHEGRFGLEQRLLPWLAELAPDIPVADWPAGTPIAQQPRLPVTLSAPLDLVAQYRVSLDYCPTFWPEHDPTKTVGEMCYADLLTNWQLFQANETNPFVVAREQVAEYNADHSALWERLGWMAAYLWVHQGHEDNLEGAVDLLLSEQEYVTDDVLFTFAAPYALGKIPPALTAVTPGEGEVAVDMRITLAYAHDSVAQFEETLLTAAERGLGAVVIAGRGEIGSSLRAQRVAARLQREGRIPETFRVIVGEYITSRTGTVVGLFLTDRVAEGETLKQTVEEIHAQGGLAYMARPGDIGAAAPLCNLPFDSFLIQPGNFELFRTLLLLDDPKLQSKPALYASNLPFTFGPGLPYSNVPLALGAADPIHTGLARGEGYAAGGLYLPWMMLLLTRPIATYQKTLNSYFDLNDYLTAQAIKILRADNVILRTSWDDEMRDLISLVHAPDAIADLADGTSPLLDFPQLTYLEAEYGRVGLGYDRSERQWLLGTRWRW